MRSQLIDRSPVDQSADSEQSLGAFWQRTARRATDAQLAVSAAVFPLMLAIALVVVFAWPSIATHWWPVVAPPLLVGSFGLWGIADREQSTSRSIFWRAVQVFAVIVAVASAAVAALWFLQRVIGTWNL